MEGKTMSQWKDVTRRQFSLISWLLPLLRIMSSRSFISPSLAPPLFITISHLRSIFARFPPLPCSLYILLLVCRTAIKMITHGSETENCPRLMTIYIYIYTSGALILRARETCVHRKSLDVSTFRYVTRCGFSDSGREGGGTNREIFFSSTKRGVVKAIRYLFSILWYDSFVI